MKSPAFIGLLGLGVSVLAFFGGRASVSPLSEDSLAVHRTTPEAIERTLTSSPSRKSRDEESGSDEEINLTASSDAEAFDEVEPLGEEPQLSSEALFSKAMRSQNMLDRRASLALAALTAESDDIPSLLAAYENRPPGGDSIYAVMSLMSAWGKFDGPSAAAYADETLNGWQRMIGAETAMQSWAENNPEDVLAWLEELENPESESWFPGVVAAFASHDLSLAESMMANMEYGRLRGRAADKILDAYQRLGTQNMLGYADGLPDERLKDGVLRKVSTRLAAIAPEEYTSWVMNIENEGNRINSLRTFMSEWASSDPEAAVKYIEKVDAVELQQTGVTAVLQTWLRNDIAAAAEWVGDMDQGPTKDSSLRHVSNRLVNSQPAVALEYALQISDGGSRLSAVKQVTERWVRQDPSGATEILGEETVRATQAAMEERRRTASNSSRGKS